ncbi:hypothetical protein NDU88_005271 [Pleurodeles waltl]|uniref:Uncharacterized protein n=1 Tax=Pleurodeles waltl TaxID=8319 RepID=A0AAV7NNH7_PLEWA|nr:hypothetical protein NDU88_005271 [Pleurodeles waltl]
MVHSGVEQSSCGAVRLRGRDPVTPGTLHAHRSPRGRPEGASCSGRHQSWGASQQRRGTNPQLRAKRQSSAGSTKSVKEARVEAPSSSPSGASRAPRRPFLFRLPAIEHPAGARPHLLLPFLGLGPGTRGPPHGSRSKKCRAGLVMTAGGRLLLPPCRLSTASPPGRQQPRCGPAEPGLAERPGWERKARHRRELQPQPLEVRSVFWGSASSRMSRLTADRGRQPLEHPGVP